MPRVVVAPAPAPEPAAPIARSVPAITPTIGLFQRPRLVGEPDEIAEVRAIWAEQERRFATVTRPVSRRCEWITSTGRTLEFCGEPRHRGSYCEAHFVRCTTTREAAVFQPFRRVG
jgi:hypothetical protein